MDESTRQLSRMLWEARVIFDDPHHPINDRRHPQHDQALAVFKLIEEEGKRLLSMRGRENG